MSWNFGDVLDGLADVVAGDRPCLIHRDRTLTWSDFTRRTNNLGRSLLNQGLQSGDKVAFYLRNSPAYSELLGACFKARLVHVNVNYRYVDEELWYILDNSDSRVVVYDAEFTPHITALRARLPGVLLWIEVTPAGQPSGAEFAVSFEQVAESGTGEPLGLQRSGDDQLFLYTGGTTGLPKGVMWAQQDLWSGLMTNLALGTDFDEPTDIAQFLAIVAHTGGGGSSIPCCPMMHGTGLFNAMRLLMVGGAIVTLESPTFDPVELWETVSRRRVTSLAIVGDAFARPMLRALEENPGRFDLSSVQVISSSGVMWSPEVKQGLLRQQPDMLLIDAFGSSEALGFGRSETSSAGTREVARFTLGTQCKVFTDDFREVRPGSKERGRVAQYGPIPQGYYKDAEKTASTFPVIDGVRYSIPGDYCEVEADGTLLLLGRGSACINTAGEKVFPEEVEEVLKTYPGVDDALVVGVPDDKWGQMVVAVVQPENGAVIAEKPLQTFVREHLAGYKTPKHILVKADLGRASNGKADYKGITQFARQQLGR